MDKNNTPIKNGKERNEKGQFVYCNTASVGHGRPKNKPSIPNMLKIIGNEIPKGEIKTRFELMSLRLWDMALKGNIRAIIVICDRLDGKAFQQFKVEVDESKPKIKAPVTIWGENDWLKLKLVEMGYDKDQLDKEVEKAEGFGALNYGEYSKTGA